MTSSRSILLLFAAMSIAGCGTLGIGRKDTDAPSRIALSLYAAADVNPNPDALTPDTSATPMQTAELAAVTVDPQAQEGPYLVNLTGGSKAELAEKMHALLDYLQEPEGGAEATKPSLQITHAANAPKAAGPTAPAQPAPAANSSPRIGAPSTIGAVTGGAVAATALAPAIAPNAGTAGKVAIGVAGAAGGAWAASSLTAPAATPDSDATVAPVESPVAATPDAKGVPATAPRSKPSDLPVPLRGGIERRTATFTVPTSKTPALGQYADGPSGLTSTQDAPVGKNVATPISFKILQLKDDSVFLNADQDLLRKDLKKALGSTYVDDDDYVLQPGQFKYVESKKIDKNTRYVAVLANFHDQSNATWKRALRIEAGGFQYSLLVIFNNIEVGMVDESHPQPPRKKS
ncbi:type VI secretion system lipoprotein TssJ [Dyella sp. ASV21]|uniref:type VI secretion system lipoprotein TssJ n=1 Tax=Dyella sp. ASV21 TaxID=2795114 RepID=UPI0018EE3A64|nr:type VI secretion system lipoprotein TssJ [Dyella sp. ASV21]